MHLALLRRQCVAAVFQQGRTSLQQPQRARLPAPASPALASRRASVLSPGGWSPRARLAGMLPPPQGHNSHVQLVTSDFLSADELPPGTHLHLIVLNYVLPPQTAFLWSRATTRICADGGANRLHDQIAAMLPGQDPDAARAAHLPDLIKGDLDSVRPDVQEFYTSRGIPMIDLSSDQETTDLEKCLLFLEGRLRGMSEQAAAAAATATAAPGVVRPAAMAAAAAAAPPGPHTPAAARPQAHGQQQQQHHHEGVMVGVGVVQGAGGLGHGARAIAAANAARAANGTGADSSCVPNNGGGGSSRGANGGGGSMTAYAGAASSSVEGGSSAQQPQPQHHHQHHHQQQQHQRHDSSASQNGSQHGGHHHPQPHWQQGAQQQQQPAGAQPAILGEILFLQEEQLSPLPAAEPAADTTAAAAAANAAPDSPPGWLSRLTHAAAEVLLPGGSTSSQSEGGAGDVPSSSSSSAGAATGAAAAAAATAAAAAAASGVHDVHASVLDNGAAGEQPPAKRLHQEHIILVLGALGGRLDHTLSNLNTLYCYRHLNMALWGDGNLVRLLRSGRSVIRPSRLEGPTCGLVPLARPATASSSGLKWDLNDTHMCFRGLLSTSNIISSDTVEVVTDEDLLWITAIGDSIQPPATQ